MDKIFDSRLQIRGGSLERGDLLPVERGGGYTIAQDEFEAIIAWLEGRDRQDAARAPRAVYQHDSNHLVPRGLSEAASDGGVLTSAYTLRSRADELTELKPVEAWAEREAELRAALQEVADLS